MCDECYVAPSVFEIEVDATLALYLYMCKHHTEKHWAEFISRHYVIRKL